MTKRAMLNTPADERDFAFRRRQMSRAVAEPDAVAFADAVLREETFADLLYARVDLARVDDGWAIMELELVEPNLFLSYDDGAPQRLAKAIQSRLD